MTPAPAKPFVALACGGTGGHLFPGIAVATELRARGADCVLLISRKDVDHEAARTAPEIEAVALPAVGWDWRHPVRFAGAALRSHAEARGLFKQRKPSAVLAMGGFTSLPAAVAGRRGGAKIFLHESNAVPGRANRLLSRIADEAFTGFDSAAAQLAATRVTLTGTPVRAQFQPQDSAAARAALGLDPSQPVLLVMGGSQGARGVNDLVLAALPAITESAPGLQLVHLTGPGDEPKALAALAKLRVRAVVRPFFARMELAMSAATVAVSRAGASTLAELAALRVPSVLVPYPHAADNHQWFNARAFERTGAARMLWNHHATPADLARTVLELLAQAAARDAISSALAQWHQPGAAARIAGRILAAIGLAVDAPRPAAPQRPGCSGDPGLLRETLLHTAS
ncbi:MAG: undecaprenyldiphospho-muramoylpentapeptide beta-N-acetylglucosaminyltransferase [Verrucomicrobia bacterium]|nr:undecaprenyldiphospho-muramoylpentapeptide beta-N-acetylglucosaminyltransferase [Verrucomicrobiota bacterium]